MRKWRVGQHPLVSRFLRVIYSSHPPAPKYSTTWDVEVVLAHLQSLPKDTQLSFTLLSHKVAMLMALSNADRCFDLAAMDLTSHSNGVKFVIPDLTKIKQSGPPLEAFYPSLPEEKLWPLMALRCYKERSGSLRKGTGAKDPQFATQSRQLLWDVGSRMWWSQQV